MHEPLRTALIRLAPALLVLGCAVSLAADPGPRAPERPQGPGEAGEPDWFPFAIPLVFPAESVIDFGQATLDAPAGSHGPVRRSGDRLTLADGTPITFWGVNSSSRLPPKEQADLVAERLRRLGANVVRLHGIGEFVPRGVIAAPGQPDDPWGSPTTALSAPALDRLDYFIAALAKRGIYTNLILLSRQSFTEADGVAEARALKKASRAAGRPASLFDPKMIAVQKDLARRLLEHRNPYTGKHYREDPAIAILEATNESSIFRYWPQGLLDRPRGGRPGDKALPEPYLAQLDLRWNDWLKAKYRDPDAVRAAWGEEAGAPAGEGFRFARPSWRESRAAPKRQRADLIDFYIAIERDYSRDMTAFLRDTLGYRGLISPLNNYYGPASLYGLADGDFSNLHGYADTPTWLPGKFWSQAMFRMRADSVFDRPGGSPIAKFSAATLDGLPTVITEWNSNFFNPYSYELPAMLPVYAAAYGWSGAMLHHAVELGERLDDIAPPSFFQAYTDPQKLALFAVGGYLYRKGLVPQMREGQTLPLGREAAHERQLGPHAPKAIHRGVGLAPETPLLVPLETRLSESESAAPAGGTRRLALPAQAGATPFRFSPKERLFAVDNGALNLATGALDRVALSHLRLRGPVPGAVVLLPLDGRPIAESSKLLLVAVSSVKNRGGSCRATTHLEDKANIYVCEKGRRPTLMRAMRLKVEIAGLSGEPKVQALDGGGVPSGPVPSTYSKEDRSLSFDFPAGTIWCLVTR